MTLVTVANNIIVDNPKIDDLSILLIDCLNKHISLKKLELTGGNVTGVDYYKCDISSGRYTNVVFRNCRFKKVNLTTCEFNNCTLDNCKFDTCNLSGVKFQQGTKYDNCTFVKSEIK